MEEIYRRDSPFLSENLSESCTAELTRSNSGESSSPTVENSNDHLLQSRNATTVIILFPLFLLVIFVVSLIYSERICLVFILVFFVRFW